MSVSLAKRETISLAKTSAGALTSITVGLGWDPAKPKSTLGKLFGGGASSIDLDASCILLDDRCNQLDMVWFRQLASKCKSIQHSGDNLTGEGDGDDESIMIDLTRLPQNIAHLAFTVNSFRGQTFNEVENAHCRVLDQNKKELCIFKLNEQGRHTGVLIATLSRAGGEWKFTAQGLPGSGNTAESLVPVARSVLS